MKVLPNLMYFCVNWKSKCFCRLLNLLYCYQTQPCISNHDIDQMQIFFFSTFVPFHHSGGGKSWFQNVCGSSRYFFVNSNLVWWFLHPCPEKIVGDANSFGFGIIFTPLVILLLNSVVFLGEPVPCLVVRTTVVSFYFNSGFFQNAPLPQCSYYF